MNKNPNWRQMWRYMYGQFRAGRPIQTFPTWSRMGMMDFGTASQA